MKLNIFPTYLLMMSIIFSSCAPLPTREEINHDMAKFKLKHEEKEGKGIVYVMLPGNSVGFEKITIFLDGKGQESEIGYNQVGEYLYFYADEGQHKVYSKFGNWFPSWFEIDIDVKKGQPIYIKQSFDNGFSGLQVLLHHSTRKMLKYYLATGYLRETGTSFNNKVLAVENVKNENKDQIKSEKSEEKSSFDDILTKDDFNQLRPPPDREISGGIILGKLSGFGFGFKKETFTKHLALGGSWTQVYDSNITITRLYLNSVVNFWGHALGEGISLSISPLFTSYTRENIGPKNRTYKTHYYSLEAALKYRLMLGERVALDLGAGHRFNFKKGFRNDPIYIMSIGLLVGPKVKL